MGALLGGEGVAQSMEAQLGTDGFGVVAAVHDPGQQCGVLVVLEQHLHSLPAQSLDLHHMIAHVTTCRSIS